MKHTLWILWLGLFLTSCERNFDEIRDTDLRFVEFSFDLRDMFSNVLVETTDGFSLGDHSGLDNRHKVRVSARCYDPEGELVEKATVFTTLDGQPGIRIKHLDKNKEYRFVFLADIVEYYSNDNYFETWYQLNDKTIDNFYITAFEKADNAKYNVVNHSVISLFPENQTVEVTLTPITINGYVVFTNYENKDKIEGYTGCYQLLRVNSMRGQTIKGSYYECDDLSNDAVKVPVTATLADNSILLDIRVRGGNHTDSTECSFQTSHRPFVTTVDCHELKILDCVNY